MNIGEQIIALLGVFLLSFTYLRGFLCGIKRYQLNNSAYKKRKKGETFKEWLFYSRYKEEIPKILLVLYFLVLSFHMVGLVTCVFLYTINLPREIGGLIVGIIVCFDIAWMLIITLLFWRPGRGRSFAYERWINKKKGL